MIAICAHDSVLCTYELFKRRPLTLSSFLLVSFSLSLVFYRYLGVVKLLEDDETTNEIVYPSSSTTSGDNARIESFIAVLMVVVVEERGKGKFMHG